MLQSPCKTLDFKKNMVKNMISPWGGGGKPYPVSGLLYIPRSKTVCRVLDPAT